MTILWLFLKVPSVGSQCVIVVFSYHTHLLSKLDNIRSGSVLGHCLWYVLLCVLSSFAIILTRKREFVALC